MSKSLFLRNAQLNVVFNAGALSLSPFLSLHTGHPGDTGTSELTGGTYARVAGAPLFGAAAAGEVLNDTLIQWTGLPDTTATPILWVGVWDALTAGNFLRRATIGNVRAAFTAASTGNLFTSYAHGLVVNDRVYLEAGIGAQLPSAIVSTTLYFVVGVTADTFQVSLTQGGAAVAIGSNGEGIASKVTPKVTNAGDVLQIAIGDISFKES